MEKKNMTLEITEQPKLNRNKLTDLIQFRKLLKKSKKKDKVEDNDSVFVETLIIDELLEK